MKKCEKCGFTTEDLDEYRKHRIDHSLGKITVSHPIPTSPKPLSLDKAAEQIEEEKKVVVVPPPPPKPSKPEPIRLKYKYEGQCPKCGGQVETLEIDLENKYIVSAYCMACKYQIAHRPVKKL